MSSLQDRLRLIRKELGYTQEQLGEICGIKKSAYSMIERGSVKLSNRNLETLILRLNISKEWLLDGTGDMFKRETVATNQLILPNIVQPIYTLVPVYDINILNSSGINNQLNILRYVPFCNAKKKDIAVVINDPSMSPTIAMNSVVLLRRCESFDPCLYNSKAHLIMLKDGRRYVRNLFQDVNDDSIVICRAANPDYNEVEIEKLKFTAIYRILAIYYDSTY